MYCAKTTVGVRKIVNDGVSETLVEALPYWTVWVDGSGPLNFVIFIECQIRLSVGLGR